MFREWNKLSDNVKSSQNYEDFFTALNYNKNSTENNYTYDSCIDTVYLSFRMKNSSLQSDKYIMGMTETNLCINCPTKKQETLYHYLLICPKHN